MTITFVVWKTGAIALTLLGPTAGGLAGSEADRQADKLVLNSGIFKIINIRVF